MSKNNTKHKRSAEEKKKLAVRVIAFLLAILMVGGMAYYTIYILTSSVSAADYTDNTAKKEITEVIDTSSLKSGGDVPVCVGLMYGDNITTGFECTTSSGYTVGIQSLNDDKDFQEIWDIDEGTVSCTADDNLYKTGMTYLIAESKSDTVVGGYHIQVDCDMYDRDEVENLIADYSYDVANLGLYIIPSYIYTGYALRIGDFSSYDEAEDYLDDVEDIFRGETVSVVSPTINAVSVLNPETDKILFEFDCGGEGEELGLVAHADENGNTYIQTPAKNIYDGVFCFKRYNNGETDGVSLINVIPLEAYLAGVLPYETSNSWPIETQKAFAVTVRSFTLTHIGKHKAYSFDLCNTTDCQVYKGAGRINSDVMRAVLETAGQVMTYDGDIVTAYYSSSMGGVSVSAQDAWGGKDDVPYLQAVETPWENYMVHNNAFWIYEISPTDLLERLHKAGFDELEDEIADVRISELAKNSTYVKKLEVTDIHGNSVTINTTDKVRTSLTPYVKSANFVVGRGEVEYTEDVIVDYVEPETGYKDIVYESADLDYGYMTLSDCYVITANGTELHDSGETSSSKVITSSGETDYDKRDIFIMAKENTAAFLGDEYLEYAKPMESEVSLEDKYNTSIIQDKSDNEVLYKMAYAEDENNFIFVGKGWGHGVGMSQYGALDMANLGYSSTDILEAYFKNIEVMNYRDSDNFR